MDSSSSDIQALMVIAQRPEHVFVHGNGSWLVDRRGKRYLDFVQGWATNALGHASPVMAAALAQQAGKLINPSPAFYNEPCLELANLLVQNSCLQRVFFTNSGAEANEGAIKLARKWGQKNRNGAFEIITFDGCFHGRTLATMSASGKREWEGLFEPRVPGFPKATFNDLESVRALVGPNTVGIMLELVQGEAGVVPADAEFVAGLAELARREGLLLLIDEVQTGVGRAGALFAYQQYGIEPDIMTLGKGIGGGVPLAALLAKEAVCCFEYGDQGGTYNGNPLMTAVGAAVLKTVIDPAFMAALQANGDYLAAGLRELIGEAGVVAERGMGMLRALVLDRDIAPQVVLRARELEPEGLLLNAPRPHLLRFMPALNVTREEIDSMLASLRQLLRDSA